jgi:cardiolipin synthase
MDELDIHIIAWVIAVLIYLIDLIVRLWLLIYIPRGRKPTAAMSWLLLIYIIPIFGTVFFFILGSTKLSKRRRRAQLQINQMLKRYTANIRKVGLSPLVKAPYDAQAKLAETLTDLGPTTNNKVSILNGYDEIIEEMTAKVRTATSYVYVEFYILALDATTEPFFVALEDAIKRGVEVRVLYDAFGSHKFPRRREMNKRLTAIGAQWHRILPFSMRLKKYNRPDLRNHRKILVIDNTDAFIGSMNMIEKTYHRRDSISYIELVAHLQGPSVNEAAAVFASDWYCETGELLKHFMTNSVAHIKGRTEVQIVPSGSGYPYQNNLKVFTSFIQTARHSVIITNPYLVPDESLLSALISAAQRGVRVSILNSEAMDQWMVGHAQRSYYEELLRAGVHIYLYKKPQLVHEKFISIDNSVGIIGSSNLDIRSFELNMECVVVAYSPKVAKKLARHQDELLQHSHEVHLQNWKQRSVWQSFLDSIARLTSALQ